MDTTLSAPLGQLLDGRYLVESQIARGGMATVYQAQDVRLERPVALKIAHPELARDNDFITRFIGEARSVARLSSPNVVAVYDQGSTGDLHYIAMEYVPGPTLRELLVARGRLNPREALDIIERVLAGLAVAHDAGIIHRDVKPENVLLGNGTSVKVADFGLARAAAGVSHTRTGLLIGTAAYLAPEQVASSSSDQRTDVYAAGVMLFEMVTGVQPHTGESPLAVAYKHVNSVVPAPSSVVPELPAALDALVALGTSRDPDLRPPDARHYLKAITEVRRSMPGACGARHGRSPEYGGAAAGPAVDGRAADGAAADGPAAGSLAGSPARDGALAGSPWPSGSGASGSGVTGSGAGDAATAMLAGGEAAGQAATGPLRGRASQFPTEAFHGQSSGGHSVVNHTMIVLAVADDFADGGGYQGGRAARQRRYREPQLQRWLFSRRILIVLAVVVVGVAAWWITEGQYFTVPSVAGITASTARSELTNAGLVVVHGTARNSDTVPKGEVIETDPAAGARVSHGARITIIASLGPQLIAVPSVTGQSLAQADKSLKAAGLTPGQPTYQTSTSIPAGVVLSTNPVADQRWPKYKPVMLVVSSGQPLPDFVGQMLTAAQGAASSGGYSINSVTVTNSSQPAGTIIQQSPAQGTPITQGEIVTVKVSAGPQQVPVPDISGMDIHQAEQVLNQAGFQVSETQIGPGHNVISYSPTGQAPQGATITIIYGGF